MSSPLYEIVELANGDVVLQRADEEGAPLVSIRFSAETLSYMQEGTFDVAKAMIEAGMEAASDLVFDAESDLMDDSMVTETPVYH